MPEINLGLAVGLLDKLRYNTGVARGSLTPQGTKAPDPVLGWFSRDNYKAATTAFNNRGWTSSSLNPAKAEPAYSQVNFQRSQYTIATNNLTEQEKAIGENVTGVFKPTRYQAIMDTYMPGRYRDEPNVGPRSQETISFFIAVCNVNAVKDDNFDLYLLEDKLGAMDFSFYAEKTTYLFLPLDVSRDTFLEDPVYRDILNEFFGSGLVIRDSYSTISFSDTVDTDIFGEMRNTQSNDSGNNMRLITGLYVPNETPPGEVSAVDITANTGASFSLFINFSLAEVTVEVKYP